MAVISGAVHRVGFGQLPRYWRRCILAAVLGVVLAVGYASSAGAAVPAPSIAISPSAHTYPVIAKGSSESYTFVVTNTGGAATGALSVSLSGRSVAVFRKTADACTAASLGPQKSCTITVAYKPATEGADDSVTLTVTGKKPVAQATASLSGTSYGPPVANPHSYTTSDDSALTVSAPGVLASDRDPDGDTLSVAQVNGSAAEVGTQVTLPSGALLTVHQDGSFSYDPKGHFEGGGTDSFTYTVSDGHGDEATATVTITVTGDGPPTANNVSYTSDEDTALTVGASTGLLADAVPFDSDDTLRLVAVNGSAADVGTQLTLPSGALLTVNSDGSFCYDPNGHLEGGGTDSFTYTVSGGGPLATGKVTITVTGDGAPTANNVSYSTSGNTALTVSASGLLTHASAFDSDDTLSLAQVNGSAADVGTQVTLPSGSVLTVNADGSFTYTPGGSLATAGGTDSFTYTVQDNHGDEATGTVTITVTAT